MRNKVVLWSAALAIPLAISGVGLAAEESMEPGMVLKDDKVAPGTIRTSRVIGTETLDPTAKDIGKIKDIVFNSSRDHVAYVVLGQAKGIVGAREKLVALPYKALKYGSPAEEHVYTILSGDVLEKAPGFDDSKWPAQANVDYYRSLDTYYNTQLAPTPEERAAAEASAEAQMASAQIGDEDMAWSQRATKLENRDVIAPNGDDLGKLEDIVIDQKTGKVVYGAFLDHRGNRHAVPLNVFTLDLTKKRLVLDTTREHLKEMPAFDNDHWPATADPRWVKPEPAK